MLALNKSLLINHSLSDYLKFQWYWKVRFTNDPWSCSCCGILAVMWSQFGHLANRTHLQWLQYPTVTWSPFATLTSGFQEANQWGSKQEIASHTYIVFNDLLGSHWQTAFCKSSAITWLHHLATGCPIVLPSLLECAWLNGSSGHFILTTVFPWK